MSKIRLNKRKFIFRITIVFLLLIAVAVFFANREVKKVGFENLSDYISNYFDNKELSKNANVKNLKIDMSDKDYKFIEDKRQIALDRGVQINVGDNYVPCTLTGNDQNISAEIRLKGHMTDHLEGDKWSFRVKSEESIFGMYRFSLQHPGTRNYAYEWVYHELLKNEDVIHLNYDFIKVNLNDKDLGIYAMEEHFGQHVLDHNNKPNGAILRWNPSLYWDWRIDELQGTFLNEEYSDYSSSYPEPYDRGVVKKDSFLIETYKKGAQLLELFRRDSLSTSEVFDVERMARFHAIIDLVGGYHSLDWSDVKFFYNGESGKIEPVGYESFSIRKSEAIAGQRIPDLESGPNFNYHDNLFSDPVFYEAYIKNLERICQESYFDDFRLKIQKELNEKLGVLATEWPYRRFSFEGYYDNIELIKHNLNLPKPAHAFLNSKSDSTIVISIAPVSDFPINISEAVVNGEAPIKLDDVNLESKPRNSFTEYKEFEFKYNGKKIKSIILKAHIPGSNNYFDIEVNEYPNYLALDSSKSTAAFESIVNHPKVAQNKEGTQWYFSEGNVEIDSKYFVEEGTELVIFGGQTVSFVDEGQLKIKGKLSISGSQDLQVVLNNNSKNDAFILENSESYATNATFVGGGKFFKVNESICNFSSIQAADMNENFMYSSKSNVRFDNAIFGSVNSIGEFNESELQIHNTSAQKGDELIVANNTYLIIVSLDVSSFNSFSSLDYGSYLRLGNSTFKNLAHVSSINNGSKFFGYSCDFDFNDYGFDLDSNSDLESSSSYHLSGGNSDDLINVIKA